MQVVFNPLKNKFFKMLLTNLINLRKSAADAPDLITKTIELIRLDLFNHSDLCVHLCFDTPNAISMVRIGSFT